MIQKKGQGAPSGPKCTKSKMVAYGFTLQENIRSLVDYRKVLLIFAMPGELVPLQLIKGNCYLVLANIEPDKYKSIAAFTLTAPAHVSMFETECEVRAGQAF
ncbi:MAG: hypothetical protein C0519_09800 [Hyphomicrobium sp.]|nr:hypothetical protein [Hyphomicrobium sp.]